MVTEIAGSAPTVGGSAHAAPSSSIFARLRERVRGLGLVRRQSRPEYPYGGAVMSDEFERDSIYHQGVGKYGRLGWY